MENRDREMRKIYAESFRDFITFWGILFLTCVVGIIELLPEFEKIKGIFGFGSISALYFVLLFGIILSIYECFLLYEQSDTFKFQLIELFKLNGLKWILIAIFLLIFTMLYLVKIGFLQ